MGAVKQQWLANLDRAEAMGREAGQAGATWLFDGNTDEATARLCVQWDDDGDPQWWDEFGPAYEPLSGQWADDPSLASVLESLELSDNELPPECGDEIACAYEQGFKDAWRDEALRTAVAMLSRQAA